MDQIIISDLVVHGLLGANVARAESTPRLNAEALAADLARLCLEEPHVKKVQVRVERLGELPFSRSIWIEIERKKEAPG